MSDDALRIKTADGSPIRLREPFKEVGMMLPLTFLVKQAPDLCGVWIALCPELDVMVQASGKNECIERLRSTIESYVALNVETAMSDWKAP